MLIYTMKVQWGTAGCSIPQKNESINCLEKTYLGKEKEEKRERGSNEKRKEGQRKEGEKDEKGTYIIFQIN